MVVVISADMPMMSAFSCFALPRYFSAGQLTPRSCTVKPAVRSIRATRFLPIWWVSPFTVAMTTVPLCVVASTLRYGLRRSMPVFMAFAARNSSGTKYSRRSNLPLTTIIPFARPSLIASYESMPIAIARCANSVAIAGSSFHTESASPARMTSRSFSVAGAFMESMRFGRGRHRAQVFERRQRRYRAPGGEQVDAVLEALVCLAQHVCRRAVQQRADRRDIADREHVAEQLLRVLD